MEKKLQKIGKGIEKVLPYNKRNIKVYAFVGESGSGKSYRAQKVAADRKIDCIIDDGLLIRGNKLLAGTSAKRARTKIQTIRDALFQSEEQQKEIDDALKKERVKSIMILRNF